MLMLAFGFCSVYSQATLNEGGEMPQMEIAEQLTAAGEQPMTPAQSSYLKTLCQRANVEYKGDLSKQAASRRIDELRDRLRS